MRSERPIEQMPKIVYDEHKGFCIIGEEVADIECDIADDDEETQTRQITNGLDQLSWDSVIPHIEDEDQQDQEQDSITTKPNAKKLKKSEKKELRQLKKVNAARKRQLRRQQELSTTSSNRNSDFNPYLTKAKIKTLHSKLTNPPDSKPTTKKRRNEPDFKIFQYNSIALYASDLDHILPGEWLNDNNISLIYELISQLFLKPNGYGNKQFGYQIQLLYPSLVQLFLHFPLSDQIESVLPVDELRGSKFIFIPINLMDDIGSIDFELDNNGDHWALVLFSVIENRIYVYDSMKVEDDCEVLKNEQQQLGELCKRLQSCKSIVKNNKPIEIVNMKCDQQPNCDDCGVYVIMFTCYLVNQLLYKQGGAIDLDIGDTI
ncbi:uncharacterized protein J8A68_002371 [[Candida] subhashii]|uniref:Ubiquitin-like protease family profile domain-containing protein n=1 Tax=[Candida] subhashii TaxID=561895 RepID=A0A8J5QRS9_9ASCO|nr:uncharacterized protein J8A68_002371 [[Candida] subhashii]KAG7664117.1 hypothetical protein J8A68_002371 [[Candida] subhashii]